MIKPGTNLLMFENGENRYSPQKLLFLSSINSWSYRLIILNIYIYNKKSLISNTWYYRYLVLERKKYIKKENPEFGNSDQGNSIFLCIFILSRGTFCFTSIPFNFVIRPEAHKTYLSEAPRGNRASGFWLPKTKK